MDDPTANLSPKAREVFAALEQPGTEAEIVARTGLNPKTVGPRLGQDLLKAGLVEVVDRTVNEDGRRVSVYARVPSERVAEMRARAQHRLRVKEPRRRSLEQRKRMVRELFNDTDLLAALAEDAAADRAAIRARRAARDELRAREREAAELRRHEHRAREADDPQLPFLRAQRTFSEGTDSARILQMMLDRDIQLERVRGQPQISIASWADVVRHAREALAVTGTLRAKLADALKEEREPCPACGAEPEAVEQYEVIDAEALDELAELVSGEQ